MMEIHQTFPQAKWGHKIIVSGGAKKNPFHCLCAQRRMEGGRSRAISREGARASEMKDGKVTATYN